MSRLKKTSSRTVWPLVMMGAGLALLAGAAVLSFGSPADNTASAPPTHSAEDVNPEIPRVGLTDAKSAYDAGTAIFVDVRDADSYAASHIPGALSIPLTQLPDHLDELDPADWIITYCA